MPNKKLDNQSEWVVLLNSKLDLMYVSLQHIYYIIARMFDIRRYLTTDYRPITG